MDMEEKETGMLFYIPIYSIKGDKMTQKKIILLICTISIIIPIIFEIFFNIDKLKINFESGIHKNIILNLDDFEKAGWVKEDNKYISQYDPMLVKDHLNIYIKTIELYPTTKESINLVQIFYKTEQDKELETKYITEIGKEDKYKFIINENIEYLRIDLGDEENRTLYNMKVIINDNNIELNFLRMLSIFITSFAICFIYCRDIFREKKYNTIVVILTIVYFSYLYMNCLFDKIIYILIFLVLVIVDLILNYNLYLNKYT